MSLPLVTSLEQFRQAVNDGSSIEFDQHGNWNRRWWICAFFRWLFGYEKSDTLELARNYARYLDMHTVPASKIRSGFCGEVPSLLERQRVTEAIYGRLKSYLQQEKEVQAGAKSRKNTRELAELRKHAEAQGIWRRIRRAEMASDCPANSHTEPQLSEKQWLSHKVQKWKEQQEGPSELTKWEESCIERACHYPEFLKELKEDPFLRHEFFTFVFRNTRGADDVVDIFVQMPKVQRRLSKTFLDMRVRRVGKHVLRVVEQDGKKDAQFLVAGQYVSITHITDRKIESNGDAKSISELLSMFKEQNKKMPTWEVLKQGIVYNNSPMPRFDSTAKEWYNTLDEYVTYSADEVQQRLEQSGCKGHKPHSVLFLKASRSSKKMTPAGNHAWLEVLIPQPDGTFRSQSFGLFADNYPKDGALANLFFTFHTHNAVIASPDCNEANFSREHAEIPLLLDSKEMFDHLMDAILLPDLLRARKKELIFQGQGSNNCAGWVQSIVDRLHERFAPQKPAPRLFELSIEALDVPAPLSLIAKDPSKPYPEHFFANVLRVVMAVLFGAAEPLFCDHHRALIHNKFWQQGKQNLPAKLFSMQKQLQHITLVPQGQ